MEIPRKAKNIPENLFLFSEEHRDFVSGKAANLPSGSPKNVWIRSAYLLLLIALPVSVGLNILMMPLTNFSFTLSILSALVYAIGFTIFILVVSLRMRKKIYASDTILIGHITKYEERFTFGTSGYAKGTGMRYTFMSPMGKQVEGFVIVSDNQVAFPDGREFPEVGTPVAILYASDLSHKVL